MTIQGVAQPSGSESDSVLDEFADLVAGARIWVRYMDSRQLLNHPSIVLAASGIQTAEIPHINFAAFHPDYCYTRRHATGALTRHHYSSRIVAWSYRNGLPEEKVPPLFRKDIYRRLRYFNVWDSEVARLRSQFEHCCLDFREFFWAIKREGVFMHTPEHPKAIVLTALAKVVCQSLGLDFDADNVRGEPRDLLGGMTWPVYPELAEEFSVKSSKLWMINDAWYDLRKFISHMYSIYHDEGAAPEDIDIVVSEEEIALTDLVLSTEVGYLL